MSTRRVLGGNIDGVFGLRTTLPGFDARFDDPSDPTKFSFNTDWGDIVYVDQIGYVDPPNPLPTIMPPEPGGWEDDINNPWLIPVAHGLNYRPYAEARAVYPGGVIYDDYRRLMQTSNGVNRSDTRHTCGMKAWSEPSTVKFNTWEYMNLTYDPVARSYAGHRVAYVIFRLPIE